MKQLFLTALLYSLFLCSIQAQKGQPNPGKIDKADLEMKDCAFDKGADALTLIDWGNIFYRRGVQGKSLFNTVYERRTRIKILKASGLSYANVKIPYFDERNEEQINKISAYTYNLDEAGNVKVTEVGKSSIYTRRINKQYSEVIITFPEAKVGSVIEYKYAMERQTMGRIKNWYFQSKIPVRYSEYQLNIPLVFRFSVDPAVIDSLETTDEVTESNIAIEEGVVTAKILRKNYIMRNLPGIREEPFMGSATDYMQHLEFQLSQVDWGNGEVIDLRKGWADILTELMKDGDFGLQLDKKIPETDAFVAQTAVLPDYDSKIKAVYDYLRNNMNWNGEQDIYSYDGLPKAFKNKTGSVADINLLLVVLLKQVGVNASPVLFSTRSNGLVSSNFPFLSQFNTVMAYAQGNDKIYILDASDKLAGYKLTPESIVNTRGFVVMGDKGKWIEASDVQHKYKVLAAVHGIIDEAGVMKGDCMVNCDGYARLQRCRQWMKDKDKFREEYFTVPNSTVKVDELQVNNADNDSLPLEQKLKFTYTLNNSGAYRNFTVNLFSDLDNNPFIADERHSDVDFGFLQDYMLFGNYTIPEGYTFEELPQNMSLIMPDTSIVFNRYMQAEDNLLNVRITVNFKRTYFLLADYSDFAAFYKKLIAKLNEPIVIKKKTTP